MQSQQRTNPKESGGKTREMLDFFNSATSVGELIALDAHPGAYSPRMDYSTAMSILALRNSLGGRFESLEEICGAPFIGPKKFESITRAFAKAMRRFTLPDYYVL